MMELNHASFVVECARIHKTMDELRDNLNVNNTMMELNHATFVVECDRIHQTMDELRDNLNVNNTTIEIESKDHLIIAKEKSPQKSKKDLNDDFLVF